MNGYFLIMIEEVNIVLRIPRCTACSREYSSSFFNSTKLVQVEPLIKGPGELEAMYSKA